MKKRRRKPSKTAKTLYRNSTENSIEGEKLLLKQIEKIYTKNAKRNPYEKQEATRKLLRKTQRELKNLTPEYLNPNANLIERNQYTNTAKTVDKLSELEHLLFLSSGENSRENMLQKQRLRWYVHQNIENASKNPETLKKLECYIKNLCAQNTEKPDRETHYRELHAENKETPANYPSLVLKVSGRKHASSRDQTLEISEPADLAIQQVKLLKKQHRALFAILPTQTVEQKSKDLTVLPFNILLEDEETLETALKLYRESPVDFETCIGIAKRI